ncbi:MAG: Response regulator of zinc sigma-54-dependent two-component system [Candidatus Ozemobacter sibiricus]|uniref:Response regulator of zinc sigma-54-dependent two-component system n=1 Tax=Candidatus Ozemobacter sibiricus TaxID=2268124 RepID=A0A367ZQB0_9BACT|nr:MAG: Response regulator of zinc sigma-54-dependent two-component system [Candidatus Ozemobacter sibiricus]
MRILIIDDDRQQAENLAALLQGLGHQAAWRTDPVQGLAVLTADPFDLTFLDMRMPGIDGLTILKRALELRPDLRIVILTAYGTIDSAVDAMKRGAFDFLVKPVEEGRLRALLDLVGKASAMTRMARLSAPTGPSDEVFVAADPSMLKVKDLIRRVAALSTTVLIYGETGTGKELVARAIHLESPRKDKPFVAVNCANLQGPLLESELFGHEKGAFTNAEARKLGKFELASGGTLFLDEIGEMPLELQAKLLRAVQEQEIERVGGVRPIRVDVRLVSATNRDLAAMVAAGRFRQDLFYRLNVFPLRLPPLRDRPNDIPALADQILGELALTHGRESLALAPTALAWLREQPWPGNIRELRNVLERAAIIDEDGLITLEDLAMPGTTPSPPPGPASQMPSTAEGSLSLSDRLEESERQVLIAALEKHRGNVVAVARELGIPRRTLYDRLKRLDLEPARFRPGFGD